MEKNRVLVCFFGVVSRSIRFTRATHQARIYNILTPHFDVDTYVFNNNVEGNVIDGVAQQNDEARQFVDNSTVWEEMTQTEIDAEINAYIEKNQVKVGFRFDYSLEICKNALRQMYSEYRVGRYVERVASAYDCVIVCGPDYYLLNPVSIEHIRTVCSDENGCFTTSCNDAQGYTNGFYIAKPSTIIPILRRFECLDKIMPINKDYEYVLALAFQTNHIRRHITSMLFVKIRSTGKAEWQGRLNTSTNREKYPTIYVLSKLDTLLKI